MGKLSCLKLGLDIDGFKTGGGGGIRTHGTLSRTTVFETAPIGLSGTPPVSLL